MICLGIGFFEWSAAKVRLRDAVQISEDFAADLVRLFRMGARVMSDFEEMTK